MIDRYPENSQGDFYVENGVCTACGAPESEAPDLIEHSKLKYGHCYFKKQPQTEDEVERAINAVAVSCISGLRYGGTDEKILRRLYEIGEGSQCDYKPTGNYKPIIWNDAAFKFNGSVKELAEFITTQFLSKKTHLNNSIINLKVSGDDSFEFTHRWMDGLTGNIFIYHREGDNFFRLTIGIEKNGHEISVRFASILLNSILLSDSRFSEILWFDKDHNTYNEIELR